jgi:UDP-3-O-[3-hydroxymyristoyl] glucosamine N-acyltransferase
MNNRLFVSNDVSLNNRLFVGSNSILVDDVSMNNRLFVSNDVSLNNRLFVGSNSILVDDVSMNNRLFVSNDVSLNNRLFVGSNTIMIDDVAMNNRLFVSNDVSLNNRLFVGSNTIMVDDVSMNNRLFVSNDTSFNSNVFIANDLSVNGAIHASEIKLDNDLTIKGKMVVHKDVSMNQKLSVGGDASFNGDVHILGNIKADLYEDNYIINTEVTNYTLIVAEDLSLNNRLFVLGDSSFNEDVFVKGDVSMNNRLFVSNDVSLNNKLFVAGKIGVAGAVLPKVSLDISATDAIRIPCGISNERPTQLQTGQIRFNTDTKEFEGYGIGDWGSLGGIKDVDQNTYISAEDTPGGDNNELKFFTAGTQHMIIDSTGDVSMNGNVSIGGDLSVNKIKKLLTGEDAYGSGSENYTSHSIIFDISSVKIHNLITTGTTVSETATQTTGIAVFNKDVIIKEDISLNQQLVMDGIAYLKNTTESTTTTSGSLIVSGGVGIAKNVNIDGTTTINGDVSMNNRLFVSNDVSLNNRLFVGSNTIMIDDVAMNNRLFVSNDVSLNNRLFVGSNAIMVDDVSMNNRLFVSNDVSLNNRLFVGSNTIMVDDVSMNNRLFVSNDVSLNNRLFVGSNTIMVDDVSMNNRLFVSNDVSLNNRLFVGSNTIMMDDVAMNNRLFVSNDVSLNNRLFVGSNTIMIDDVSMNNRLFVSNDVSLNNRLFVGSNTIMVDDVSMNNRLFVSNDVSLNNRLFVGSNTIMVDDVSMNNRLFVSNDVSLNNRLFVGSNTIMDDDVSMNNRLFVSNDVSLNNHLFVAGKIGVAGAVLPNVSLDISATDAIRIPCGLSNERPTQLQTGQIRFNTESQSFEGYGTNSWGSLGGIKDVDQNTFISAEDTPGYDNNELKFFTAGTDNLRMIIDSDGDVSMNGNLNVVGDASFNGDVHIFGDLKAAQINNEYIINTEVTNYTLIVAEDLSLNNRLFVLGDASFNEDVFVKGDVSMNQKLSVGGDVSMNNNVDIGGNLTVSGNKFNIGSGDGYPGANFTWVPSGQWDGALQIEDHFEFTGQKQLRFRNENNNITGNIRSPNNVKTLDIKAENELNLLSNTDGIRFYTNSTSINTNERMVIDHSGDVSMNGNLNVVGDASFNQDVHVAGNVGIGKSNPSYSLDVSGKALFGNTIGSEGIARRTFNVISPDAVLRVARNNSKGWSPAIELVHLTADGNTVNSYWDLYNTQDNRFSIRERTTENYYDYVNILGANGNVGIGITNPSKKLDIDGDISLNSDLFMDTGGVIKFNDNNITLTHSNNKLTFGGSNSPTFDFNNKAMTNVNINSGTIDGTDITVGNTKTLDVSTGTLTTSIAQNKAIIQGANADVDFGEFDVRAKTVTADGLTSGRVVFAGTGGVLSDNSNFTFDNTTNTLTATKIGAFEAAGSIDFASQDMTNVNINSGTIDNTAIGANNASTGKFTTLHTTSDASFNNDVFIVRDLFLNQKLSVGGDASFNGDVHIFGNIKADKYEDNYIINTEVTNYTLIVAEDLSLNNRLFVLGDASFNEDVYVKGNLSIDGDLSLNNNFIMDGDMSMNGQISLNNNVKVGKTSKRQYVFIQNNDTAYDLTIRELQIINEYGINQATNGTVIYSSQDTDNTYTAGNINNDISNSDYASTHLTKQAINNIFGGLSSNFTNSTDGKNGFFGIDLGEPKTISQIKVFGNTDSGNNGQNVNRNHTIYLTNNVSTFNRPTNSDNTNNAVNTTVNSETVKYIDVNYDYEQYDESIAISNSSDTNVYDWTYNFTDTSFNIYDTNIHTDVSMSQNLHVSKDFSVGDGEKFKVDYITGNVGIGTTTPLAKLEIHNTAEQIRHRFYGGMSQPGLFVLDDLSYNANTTTGQPRPNAFFCSNNNYGADVHQTNGWVNSSTTYDIAGSIGLGAPNPYFGDYSQYAQIRGLRLGMWDGGLAFATMGPDNDGKLIEKMRIIHNGNVGIGTANPSVKLDVSGNIKVSNEIRGTGNHLDLYGGNDANDSNGYIELRSGGTIVAGNKIEFRPNSGTASYGNTLVSITSIGTTENPSAKLEVVGTTESTSFNATSDIRHKENIHELENALDKILSIRGVNFTFIDDDEKHLHAGIIAQEVQPIIPELINTTNDDKWTANYDGLTPYLIESVKTLSKDNKELKDKIKTLETKIDLIMQQLNP